MVISRRHVLRNVSAVSAVVIAGCSGSSDGGSSCGPGDTTVEELAEREPTGIVEDAREQVDIVGSVEDVAGMSGEYIVVDDTTGLAELRAGPGFQYDTQNLPDTGTCISGFGFHVSNDSERADVVLSDVAIEQE